MQTNDRLICLACTSDRLRVAFEAREMMFGTRDRFVYMECSACGSLQIEAIPDDLDAHYPATYYAYRSNQGLRETLRRTTTAFQAREDLGKGSVLGRAANRWRGQTRYAGAGVEQAQRWVAGLPRGFESRILDVGCGSGELLSRMRKAGFRHVVGIDPYLPHDTVRSGIPLLKRTTEQARDLGRFDLVMLHHVFEHVPDPRAVLVDLASALTDRGRLLIRVPVAASSAARDYGKDWVQLDPPRHLLIPSEQGMHALADRAGLRIDAVEYDSTEFQFWASEQYAADIPLTDPRSATVLGLNRTHTAAMIDAFSQRARRLNAEGDGDQAAFFLSLDSPTTSR